MSSSAFGDQTMGGQADSSGQSTLSPAMIVKSPDGAIQKLVSVQEGVKPGFCADRSRPNRNLAVDIVEIRMFAVRIP